MSVQRVTPKKYFGQHFLKDLRIAERIAETIPDNIKNILEIGSGTGALTQFLLKKKRNGAGQASGAEFATAAVDVSRWPEGLGMAVLFDPERVRECAAIISREYRALGITTALGPQIDLSLDRKSVV